MASLVATNEVCELPVYRPLIGFDKQEIVEVSEKIGTYETSILPYEDCCTVFVPKEPKTRQKVDACEKDEAKIVCHNKTKGVKLVEYSYQEYDALWKEAKKQTENI